MASQDTQGSSKGSEWRPKDETVSNRLVLFSARPDGRMLQSSAEDPQPLKLREDWSSAMPAEDTDDYEVSPVDPANGRSKPPPLLSHPPCTFVSGPTPSVTAQVSTANALSGVDSGGKEVTEPEVPETANSRRIYTRPRDGESAEDFGRRVLAMLKAEPEELPDCG